MFDYTKVDLKESPNYNCNFSKPRRNLTAIVRAVTFLEQNELDQTSSLYSRSDLYFYEVHKSLCSVDSSDLLLSKISIYHTKFEDIVP